MLLVVTALIIFFGILPNGLMNLAGLAIIQ